MDKKPIKIALIGMMGTGKTAVGPVLAQNLNIPFADLDNIIVSRMGMSIAQAFITYGQKTFRSYETAVLGEVLWHEEIVISCGGGVALNPENIALLDGFKIVRLTASAQTIHERIKDDFSRPLINDNSVEALQRIILERDEAYSKAADITVNTDNKSIDEVASEIFKLLGL